MNLLSSLVLSCLSSSVCLSLCLCLLSLSLSFSLWCLWSWCGVCGVCVVLCCVVLCCVVLCCVVLCCVVLCCVVLCCVVLCCVVLCCVVLCCVVLCCVVLCCVVYVYVLCMCAVWCFVCDTHRNPVCPLNTYHLVFSDDPVESRVWWVAGGSSHTFVAESPDECARAVTGVTPQSSLFSLLSSLFLCLLSHVMLSSVVWEYMWCLWCGLWCVSLWLWLWLWLWSWCMWRGVAR